MKTCHAPNKSIPTPGRLVVLGGSDGRGWDVETRETDGSPALLVGRFNSLGDAHLFAAANNLLAACKMAASVAMHHNMRQQFPEMVESLLAAIAQAEGH